MIKQNFGEAYSSDFVNVSRPKSFMNTLWRTLQWGSALMLIIVIKIDFFPKICDTIRKQSTHLIRKSHEFSLLRPANLKKE